MCFCPIPSYQKVDGSVKMFPLDTVYVYYHPLRGELVPVSSKEAEWFFCPYHKIYRDELLMIPCGHCLDCRLTYSREWANRCIVEARDYKDNYFLTLTYNNASLPQVSDFGEVLDHATLVYRDIQRFNDSLRIHWRRKYNHNGIRFFMAGEYGPATMRPHYHMIVFNLPLFDLQLYKNSDLGDSYYTSEELNHIWRKGFIVVGALTRESAAYTARYCLKKIQDGLSDIYDELNIKKEFTQMSRKPGIGREFYERNKDKLFKQGFLSVSDGKAGMRIYPGRYYKQLYKNENEAEYLKYAEIQKYKAQNKLKIELMRTDLDELEYNAVKEANALARTKILFKRSDF